MKVLVALLGFFLIQLCSAVSLNPLSTVKSPEGNTFLCPADKPFGFFHIPNTCGREYYSCVNGSPYVLECPLNEIFDPLLLTCVPEAKVSCCVIVNLNCCTGKPNGFYEFPGQCTPHYHACVSGKSYTQTCSSGMLFDAVKTTCVPMTELSCNPVSSIPTTSSTSTTTTPSTTNAHTNTSTTPSTTYSATTTTTTTTPIPTKQTTPPSTGSPTHKCPEPNGFFPIDEGICGQDYYSCTQGSPYVLTCPSGFLFDPALLICIDVTLASCNFQCPAKDGFYPIPGNSKNYCIPGFIRCNKKKAFPGRCPKTSTFNPQLLKCVQREHFCDDDESTKRVSTATIPSTTKKIKILNSWDNLELPSK